MSRRCRIFNPQGLVVLVMFVSLAIAAKAVGVSAMAFYRSSEVDSMPDAIPVASHFADIATYPDDRLRWSGSTIHYHADNSFNLYFHDPIFAKQVGTAFATWSAAGSTPNGSILGYYQRPAAPHRHDFFDFRSLVLHEIGHTLGLTHPDDAEIVTRNFAIGPGGTVFIPTPSSLTQFWVMSSIDLSADVSAYNQLFSWDDLAAYRYQYSGTILNFKRMSPLEDPDTADIKLFAADFHDVIHPDADGVSAVTASELAHAFIVESDLIDQTNARQGRNIRRAEIWFNTHPETPVGVRTKMVNWQIQQRGSNARDVVAIEVQTRRASNPEVLHHFDGPGSPGPGHAERFVNYVTRYDQAAIKDSLLHSWTNPFHGPIAGSTKITVGLRQDVHHWYFTKGRLRHPTTSPSESPFTTFTVADIAESAPVFDSVVMSSEGARDASDANQKSASTDADESPLNGILLRNPITVTMPITLTALSIGDATQDREGNVIDVSAITLTQLTELGVVENFAMIPITPTTALGEGQVLQAGEEFHLFVSGDRSQLPDTMTNYLFLSDVLGPDVTATLKDRPLVVAATVETNGALVTTYTVIGIPPIVGIAEVDNEHKLYFPDAERTYVR